MFYCQGAKQYEILKFYAKQAAYWWLFYCPEENNGSEFPGSIHHQPRGKLYQCVHRVDETCSMDEMDKPGVLSSPDDYTGK
ncbi:hypothetical protein QF016_002783 [Pseudomonas marginalis]|nr:hypothetical protein [Pseudomonas marginalis]